MLNKKREDRWNQIINNETCDGECPWHWDQCQGSWPVACGLWLVSHAQQKQVSLSQPLQKAFICIHNREAIIQSFANNTVGRTTQYNYIKLHTYGEGKRGEKKKAVNAEILCKYYICKLMSVRCREAFYIVV